MSTLFGDFSNTFNSLFDEFRIPGGLKINQDIAPTSDFKATYEIAGVKKNEIDVSYANNQLLIKINSKYKGNRSVCQSLRADYYDVDKIDVKYEDGLLEIKVPLKRTKESDVKKIEIK